MTELLAFFGEHTFLAWSALWLAWMPYVIYIMTLKMIAVMVTGKWPPPEDEDD